MYTFYFSSTITYFSVFSSHFIAIISNNSIDKGKLKLKHHFTFLLCLTETKTTQQKNKVKNERFLFVFHLVFSYFLSFIVYYLSFIYL